MSIYLIMQENELHLHEARPEQEEAFQFRYGQQILMSGDISRKPSVSSMKCRSSFATGVNLLFFYPYDQK
jgi:hypothetical protein